MFSKRFKTRKVSIGNVDIGGNNPIRVQSMTNTKTEDIENTCLQILRLQEAGCEIVRVTIQGKKQAYALEKIKNNLIQKNCLIPIVADIHFYPPAAFIAADFVEKIRINPGNFAEQKGFSDLSYIEEKLFLLIEKLRKNKVILRIGINHGSLSDRIMAKYGNTVEAMIVSAIEYTHICRKYDFHDIVYSMKSSSSFVMIEAYKKLVKEMKKLNWNYPLHLGVTEAGDLEDGVIKSSVGIGALLLQGIGDTIRVSLTEDPIKEIKPAKNLIKLIKNKQAQNNQFLIRKKKNVLFGFKTEGNKFTDHKLALIDLFYVTKKDQELIKKLKLLNKVLISKDNLKDVIKIHSLKDSFEQSQEFILEINEKDDLDKIKKLKPKFFLYKLKKFHIDKIYKFHQFLKANNIDIPVILDLKYEVNKEDKEILASSEIGLMLFENLLDGILFDSNLDLYLKIFQSCSLKKYKTEYISCPGCGRALFDIQKTLKSIKEKTAHLSDVKIAVMGCIVNGPGEMQNADFGYVGSQKNKVDLYVKNECIEKNIDETQALDKLILTIKKQGMWKD